MVKIAFHSPFARKDEPKKEAAEALVADKVRAGPGLRSLRSNASLGRRHLLPAAAGRGPSPAPPSLPPPSLTG